MDKDAYWAKYQLTTDHAEAIQASHLGKTWKNGIKFNEVNEGDIIMVSYDTNSQLDMFYYDNQCGFVMKLNCDEDGNILSFTLKIYGDQEVDVPYENEEPTESMGGYTNDHTTYISKLE
jgi:hypothetical protein